MYRAEEKQIEHMIGQAILILLQENAAITFASLRQKLQSMVPMTENDASQKKAIFSAIKEITAVIDNCGNKDRGLLESEKNKNLLMDSLLTGKMRLH